MKITKSEGIENIVPATTSGEFKTNLDNYCADVVLLYATVEIETDIMTKEKLQKWHFTRNID
jgi:hypothetical protein